MRNADIATSRRMPTRTPSVETCGDQEFPWTWLVPSVWRAVADPAGVHKLPTLRSTPEARFGIWTAVLQLALFSFAWPSPATGVRNWLHQGLPTEDRRLQVIAHLLGDNPAAATTEFVRFLTDRGSLGPQISLAYAGLVPDIDHSFLASLVQEQAHRGWDGSDDESKFLGGARGGGGDPLHLSGHIWAPVERPPTANGSHAGSKPSRTGTLVTRLDGGRGTGVLMLDEYAGWYGNLTEQCGALPGLPGGRSWRIDVVVRPLGWLGRFRRSRDTGLWFSGPHRYHQLGTR